MDKITQPMPNPTTSELIDLFLCHNGADKDWVRELAEQIESETFDGTAEGRTLRVFFDAWDIDKGENILLKLNEALTKARYIALVLSPEMLAAPWPTLEWTHAVTDDPTNRKGRLIPLFLRDYSEKLKTTAELPAPLKALNWIDFRRSQEFKKSYLALINKVRDKPPIRGKLRTPLAAIPAAPLTATSDRNAEAPAPIRETILGNLLAVQSYPQTIWSAPTTARQARDVTSKVKDAPAFELQGGRLYTFADLSRAKEGLRDVVQTADIRTNKISEWKDDPVKWRWIVALLNRCLKLGTRGLPLGKDNKGRYFFLPKDGEDRTYRNANDPSRTVAAKKDSPDGLRAFWVHHGAQLAFMGLGERLYLLIEPCYVFTSDGSQGLGGPDVGPLSIKWGGKERNASILRHVAFWSRTLARGAQQIALPTGAQPVIISMVPATAQTSFGIENDAINFRTLLKPTDDELELAAQAFASEVLAEGTTEGELET